MAEAGGDKENEIINSNGGKIFAVGLKLLSAHGKQVGIVGLPKSTQAIFPVIYDGKQVQAKIKAGKELDKLNKAGSISVNIGGRHGEWLMIKKELGSSGQNTYKVYGEKALDPAGTTLDNSPGGDKRARDVLNALHAIESEADAENLPAQKIDQPVMQTSEESLRVVRDQLRAKTAEGSASPATANKILVKT